MKTLTVAILSLVAIAGVTAAAGPATQTSLTPQEVQLISEAASANIAERELGRLATARAHAESVKRFGREMLEEHGRLQNRVEELAKRKGIALPASMTPEQRETVARLTQLEGAAFDRAYMSAMRAEHEKSIARFERMGDGARDPEVRQLAQEALPVLREHAQQARTVADAIGGSRTSGVGAGAGD